MSLARFFAIIVGVTTCTLLTCGAVGSLMANTGNHVGQTGPPARVPVLEYGWEWRVAAASAGELPLWLHSNRMGALDRYSANGSLRWFGSWHRTYSSGVGLRIHADMLFRGAAEPVLWLHEGYIEASYGHFQLTVGRKREIFGLVHPQLTSGTMDHSLNARAMPKISVSTDGFRTIPGTRRVFYYSGSLAHGWMDDHAYRYMDGVWLHQKHLYLRMFTEDAPFVPRAGLKHFAQWGGSSEMYGTSPKDLRAYRDVFLSLASDSREIFHGGELLNQLQNHVGMYDFAVMLNLGRYRMGVSRQFLLEDTPNARFGTPWDGMWGGYIELRPDSRTRWRADPPDDWRYEHRPLLRAINYEYINTLDGLTRYPHRDREDHVNYYNHYAYRGGWTYHGRVIGHPLYFGAPGFMGVVNNILVAHHVGMDGFAGPVAWRLFTTYSRNYGAGRVNLKDGGRTWNLPGRQDQWYFLLELESEMSDVMSALGFERLRRSGSARHQPSEKFHRTATSALIPGSRRHFCPMDLFAPMSILLSAGYDRGEVFAHNFGLMITVRWMSAR